MDNIESKAVKTAAPSLYKVTVTPRPYFATFEREAYFVTSSLDTILRDALDTTLIFDPCKVVIELVDTKVHLR
jgi:uncharacterized protein (DUF2225 family)